MEPTPTKKQTSPLLYIGIGCLILLFLIGVGTTIFFKFFAKKAMEGVIESQTGVDITDVENGKMTYTDKNSGAKVEIGGNTVPDSFPKDFPLYPGAKVTSSLSGEASGKNNGFWLTMTSPATVEEISQFYKSELTKNGWTTESTFTAGTTTTQTVKKADWGGTLSVSKEEDASETQIVIILGQEENQ